MPQPIRSDKLVLEVLSESASLLTRLSNPAEHGSTLLSYSSQPYRVDDVNRIASRIREVLQSAAARGALEICARELEEAGKALLELLLPDETTARIRSCSDCELVLMLDEKCVHLPWELLHDGKDFLCCKFSLSRIVRTTTQVQSTRRKPGRRQVEFLLVSNPTGDLPHATEEADHLRRIFMSEPRLGLDWYNQDLTASQLAEILPDYDALHFCGHGFHDSVNPEESGWRLREGRLTARTLQEYANRGIAVPALVFNNACCGGQTEAWERGGGGDGHGMASAFLRAGCRHYIGALACLADQQGREFTAGFYAHVLAGQPVGRAMQLTRNEARLDADTQSLAWAQYILYGAPEGYLFPSPEQSNPNPDRPENLANPSGVLTLVLVEVSGAQSLIEEQGAIHADGAIRDLHQSVLDVLSGFEDGWEVCSLGYGRLLAFQRPSEAVLFSLIAMARGSSTRGALRLRVGLHAGEIAFAKGSDGSDAARIEGPAADVAQRILHIAQPGQILMSRPVFDNARAVLHARDLHTLVSVAWLDHGAYRLKGCGDPVGICEVGEKQIAPLAAPADSPNGHRYLSPDQEPVLGWRPALDQPIPTSPRWVLSEKLGVGAFGEVWRAKNRDSGNTRVFKFCFREDRVRSLKREAALFRLLSSGVGEHPRIIRIEDIYFDEPPYYIGLEDFGGRDLGNWWRDRESGEGVPFQTRLEIVIQAAEALQAAHDAGVIHRDVKPSNILVGVDVRGPQGIAVKLTDFGVGQVVSRELLAPGLSSGFTETFSATEMGSIAGSRLYIAPEVLSGRPASTRSDIYSLGIILYQILVGDLNQPLTGDWRGLIEDDLLAEDLSLCLAGEPAARFQSAGQLADSLRSYERRRRERQAVKDHERKVFRRHRWVGVLVAAATALSLLAVGLGYGLIQERRAHVRAEEATRQAEAELYISSLQQVLGAIGDLRFDRALDLLLACPVEQRNWEWGHLLHRCNQDAVTLRGHADEVGAVAYGPDGSWLVSCSSDGTIRMWNFRTGREIRRFEGAHAKPVWALDVSPDGRTIATGAEDGSVVLWDAASGRSLHVLKGKESVETVAFSPDGRLLASGGREATVRLWDVAGGEATGELVVNPYENIFALAFSPDGHRLAESAGLTVVKTPRDQTAKPVVRIIDLAGKQVVSELPHPELVRSIAFDPSGKRLVSGGHKNLASLWDLETQGLVWRVDDQSLPVWSVAFLRDGDSVATAGMDRTIKVRRSTDGREIQTLLGHSAGIYSIGLSPTGNELASASGDGTIKIWDVSARTPKDTLEGGGSGISSLAFSPNGRLLAGAAGRLAEKPETKVCLWDPLTGGLVRAVTGFASGVCSVSMSPDGNRLCVGACDLRLRTYSLATSQIHREVRFTERPGATGWKDIVFCPFSPDGKRLAVGLKNGELSVWDSDLVTKISSAPAMSENAELLSLIWSPTGRELVSSWGIDGIVVPASIEFRNAETLNLERSIPAHASHITDIEFSPDRRLLASAGMDGVAKLWDLADLRASVVLRGHRDYLTSVAFTPDSTRLVTGSVDSEVKIWRLDKEQPREVLDLAGVHTKEITEVAISPDGRIIATGSQDGTIHLWRALPWRWDEYPGSEKEDPFERIEKYKRSVWGRANPL